MDEALSGACELAWSGISLKKKSFCWRIEASELIDGYTLMVEDNRKHNESEKHLAQKFLR